MSADEAVAAGAIFEHLAAGPRPRRVCGWHLLDLTEAANGGFCCRRGGRRHHPRAWLVVDSRGRILAAGRDCVHEPDAIILDPPMRLSEYVREVWVRLCWPRAMFGHGAQQFRVPVAARRSIVARRKSVRSLDPASAIRGR